MKNFKILYLMIVLLLTIGCSSDNESFQSVTETTTPQEDTQLSQGDTQLPQGDTQLPQGDAQLPNDNIQIPMESLADIGAVAIEGYPKMIKKFENGKLSYWGQYYFGVDGNIFKLNYGHSSSAPSYSMSYQYDAEGKIKKLIGWDDFHFYWDNTKIIKVESYNAAWYGKYDIFYDYNNQGQVIQKLVVYYGTTPITSLKSNYSYFVNGNLKSIKDYVDSNGTGTFKFYSETDFSNYIEPKNLFLDLEIIPGQSELLQFPGSKEFKHFISSGYDFYETYSYKYDANGRVIEKLYGNNKIVYEYY